MKGKADALMAIRFLSVAVVCIFLGSCSRGAELVVVNESNLALVGVTAFSEKFTVDLGDIEPRSRKSVRIYPRGESGVGLRFVANGKEVSSEPAGYFEGGGDYRVTATVSPTLDVTVTSGLVDYPN